MKKLKRIASVCLTLAVLASCAVSSYGAGAAANIDTKVTYESSADANPDDAETKSVVNKVKSMISIPNELDQFSISEQNKAYSLNWGSSKPDASVSYINVTFYNDLIIYYTSRQMYSESNEVTIPKIDKAQALANAETWLKKANPVHAKNIKIVGQPNDASWSSGTYYFSLIYEHDGIPVSNVNGGIGVSINTGEVSNYSFYMNGRTDYPLRSKAISVDQARKVFEENIELVYYPTKNYGSNSDGISLAYKPSTTLNIDALTGELTECNTYSSYLNYGNPDWGITFAISTQYYVNTQMGGYMVDANKTISENKLISASEAEKIVKSYPVIGAEKLESKSVILTDNFTNFSEQGKYLWNLIFCENDQDVRNGYICAVVSAETGNLVSFNRGTDESGLYIGESTLPWEAVDIEPIFDKFKDSASAAFGELAGKNAERFELRKFDVFEQNTNLNFIDYNYIMKVNGIDFPEGRSVIKVSEKGKILGAELYYCDFEFPKPDNIISKSQALEEAYSKSDFSLRYFLGANSDTPNPYNTGVVKDTKLVYSFDPPFIVDAVSGKHISTNYQNAGYTDIAGTKYESEIEKLADVGIYFQGPELMPDSPITHRDFLMLCATVFQKNGGMMHIPADSDEYNRYADEFVTSLVRSKTIGKTPENPQAQLTRGQMAEYLAAFIGITDYVDLKDTFIIPYSDVTSGIGAVALLKGIGVLDIQGDRFEPSKLVTRAEALHFIYNYLCRK